MNILRWIVFAIAAFAMNFPVIVTLITSFKSAKEIATNPGLILQAPTIANYAKVLTDTSRFNIYAFLLNSTVAAFIASFLALLLCLPAAYAIVKTDVGTKHLLPIVANLRAVPLVVFAIPLYMMFQFVGLLDTRTGLGLILTIVNLPLSLMMMVNAIVEIPREIDEAARMDKANAFAILRRIVAPVIRPAMVTALIFGFIAAWNEYLFGLMMTTRQAVPITVGASFFFSASGGGIQWGAASAVMILGALPPAILGCLIYRQLTGSITAGAVKG
ncbi:carbohydrate ABC transporter permease [Rhizobium sp. VS19-DR104.2]|uniref:carbohydrate ABC transporter permease n=1 Tax=unclassified Rhizobium TaxID=2613769 RepID=UPI001C5B66F7|nr:MULTISPECIES: carbohydrate ABC transporter permease [unclassified Rhizobium]MBZ5762383.1 carbohydrate ABC transporter permease [Rhizobium sp. VS19-DR96]MBZ5769135.1 carbohydrate ABC transporter permease [Rhizobium sp. VS19-DR129.2]MBZ5775963.1 carbohydrate ABC transporter permease [Rhizobium sp. VS19-DRK62.2]MBZ5786273.1 carbohydrate ABC transporter permease [Rhizobium sp. VS19-DR121]MBZ5804267.1 carbohydrate ABC transporter permease [Rhizobium sp. VS19-DR181]